ncbi:MAG TPA: porin [Bdellovibrionota bacterium]|nr:porin [Bdellovibrionota bacterium]
MRRLTDFLIVFFCSTICSFAWSAEDIPNVRVGYRDGFYISTTDNRFSIKIGGRLNFGYTYGLLDTSDNFSSFDLAHAKLYLGGNAFGPAVQYYIQAGSASNTRLFETGPAPESEDGGFRLEDFFVRLIWDSTSLKLGQFKTPFGRQWMTYSGNFEFVDRSIPARFFSLGRDRGVTLNGDKDTFSYTFGIFNGGSTLEPAAFSTSNPNVSNDASGGAKGHLYLARIMLMPWGSAGYSEGDVEMTEGHKLEFASGFVYDDGRDVDFGGDGIVDDPDAPVYSAQGEVVWKSAGKSIQGEFFYRWLNRSVGRDVNSYGFYIQPGIFLMPNKWELATRFGWLDPDLGVLDDLVLEAAAASNLYFSGDHRYKAQLQYTWKGQETAPGNQINDHFIDLMFQLTI